MFILMLSVAITGCNRLGSLRRKEILFVCFCLFRLMGLQAGESTKWASSQGFLFFTVIPQRAPCAQKMTVYQRENALLHEWLNSSTKPVPPLPSRLPKVPPPNPRACNLGDFVSNTGNVRFIQSTNIFKRVYFSSRTEKWQRMYQGLVGNLDRRVHSAFNIFFFYIYLLILCVWAGTHGGQRTTCRTQFSPSLMRVPGH